MNQLSLICFSIAAGVAISLPMGPVGALILANAMKSGFSGGTITLTALILGEIPYIAMFYFGISGYLIDNPYLKHPLMIFGGGFMIFLGITHLANKVGTEQDLSQSFPHPAGPDGFSRIFGESFLLTLGNPAILVVFASVLGSAYALLGEGNVRAHILQLLIFLEIGTILFFLPLIFFAARLGKSLPREYQRKIDIFAGAFLAIFGTWVIGSDLWGYFNGT